MHVAHDELKEEVRALRGALSQSVAESTQLMNRLGFLENSCAHLHAELENDYVRAETLQREGVRIGRTVIDLIDSDEEEVHILGLDVVHTLVPQ